MINYRCSHCGADMTSPDMLAGATDTCPSCGQSVYVPLSSGDAPQEGEFGETIFNPEPGENQPGEPTGGAMVPQTPPEQPQNPYEQPASGAYGQSSDTVGQGAAGGTTPPPTPESYNYQQNYNQQSYGPQGGYGPGGYYQQPGYPMSPQGGYYQPTQMAPGAVAALVCGIIGIVIYCTGLILGIIAITQAKKARDHIAMNPQLYGGGGMATAGMVLGIIATIIGGLAVCLWAVALAGAA